NDLDLANDSSAAITLTADVIVGNDVYFNMGSGDITGGFNIDVGRNLNINTGTGAGFSTGSFIMKGTGTINGTSGATISSIGIDAGVGTVTLNGIIDVDNNWVYTSGTVDPGTSTVRFPTGGNDSSIDSDGMSFNDVVF